VVKSIRSKCGHAAVGMAVAMVLASGALLGACDSIVGIKDLTTGATGGSGAAGASGGGGVGEKSTGSGGVAGGIGTGGKTGAGGVGGVPGTGGMVGSGGAIVNGGGGGGVATGGMSGTAGAATGGTSTGGLSGTGGGATGGGIGGSAGMGGGGAGGLPGSTGGLSGSAGSGGSGTGGDSNGAACAGKTYKICEDFENGAVDGLPAGWTSLKGFTTASGVGLASDQAHGGAQSLKTSAMTTGPGRIQKSLASLGATATNHWGRLYFKVKTPAKPASSSNYYHITFAALQGTTENRVVDLVEAPDGTIQYIYNVPDDSCCTGSRYEWTLDGNWHCAEWHVEVATQSYRFFIDNKEVTSIGFSGNANAKMSSYTALALGAFFYVAPNGTLTTWIDDLAIDDKQIGCM